MASTLNFKIAIVGAGPAGLTFASLLTASPHAFDFTIFETRGKPDPSSVNIPSGSLDLQEDFGLQAIQACGLYDRFRKIECECTEQTIICDKHGIVHLNHTGEGRPEIERNALTQLLLSSIAEGSIRWNTKVLRVIPANGSEKNIVEFTDSSSRSSTSETYDLIVGADGAWSRARSAIPSAPQTLYSSVCSITIDIPRLRSKDPDLDAMIGGGTYAACGDGKVVLAQRGVDRSARVYLFLHSKCQDETEKELQSSIYDEKHGPNPTVDPTRLLSSLPSNYKDLQGYLLRNPDMFPTWSDDIKRFIALACEAQPADAIVDARPLYMLPLHPFPHPHQKGIALVGDSAHLMTPFAGKGVNTAMADGHSLAKQLEQMVSSSSSEAISADDLDRALIAFEEESHPKAKDAMNLTWMSLLLSYEDGAPTRLAKIMASK